MINASSRYGHQTHSRGICCVLYMLEMCDRVCRKSGLPFCQFWETKRFSVKIHLLLSKTEQNSYVTLTAAWKCTPGLYMYSFSHDQIGMICNSDYSQQYTYKRRLLLKLSNFSSLLWTKDVPTPHPSTGGCFRTLWVND